MLSSTSQAQWLVHHSQGALWPSLGDVGLRARCLGTANLAPWNLQSSSSGSSLAKLFVANGRCDWDLYVSTLFRCYSATNAHDHRFDVAGSTARVGRATSIVFSLSLHIQVRVLPTGLNRSLAVATF